MKLKSYLITVIVLICYQSIFAQTNGLTDSEKIASAKSVINANSTYFIENKGQWDDNVLFMAQSKSLRAWITKNSIIFVQHEKITDERMKNIDKIDKEHKTIKGHAVGVEFVNPSRVVAVPGEAGKTKYNFILGNDKSKHKSGCLQYSEVKIENIYEGIDMKYYFDNGELRYDFIVKPGANPELIEMEIKGSDKTYIEDGNIVMETSLEPLIKTGLKAYQNNKANQVACNFKLTGNKLKFELGEYDKTKELVIDPLTKIGYTFTMGFNDITEIVIDSDNSIYFAAYTGYTTQTGTLGKYDENYNGGSDVVIGRIDENWDFWWVTFFGSADNDRGRAIRIDDSKIYFSGWTEGEDLPITALTALKTSNNGERDGFFAVLDKTGENLLYSTYYGTDDFDMFNDMDRMSSIGDIYLVGITKDADDFATNLTEKQISGQTYVGQTQGIVVILRPITDENGLSYDVYASSLFGGNNESRISNVYLDNIINTSQVQNFYISGETKSSGTSFHTTQNAYRTDNTQNEDLVSLTNLEINYGTNTISIVYNTFFANCQIEFNDFEVFPLLYIDDKFYFAGCTRSNSIPTTTNAFDRTYSVPADSQEAFLGVIDTDISGSNSLIYSSYFGGSWHSGIKDLDYINECNKLIFTGWTRSELDNYQGILNEEYDTGMAHMVGIVDISLNGYATLTDLAYLRRSSGYTQNWGNTIKHKTNSNSLIYTGGGSEGGTSAFKLGTEKCPCVCHNGLLGVTSSQDHENCENESQCNISVTLFITPVLFSDCYKYYQIIDVDGTSQLIPFPTPFPYGMPFQIKEFCINTGTNYSVTVKLYKDSEDLNPCELTGSAVCPCYCPVDEFDRNNLVLIEARKGESPCGENECKIVSQWNIPEEVTCYTHYKVNSGNVQPWLPSASLGLPSCIPEGQSLSWVIELMKSSTDEDPCIIEKTIFCPIEDAATPCVPDCENDWWETQEDLTIAVNSTCKIRVSYVTRHACPESEPPDGYQDMQITKIEFLGDGLCDGISLSDLFNIATDQIILTNRMNFDPKSEFDPCSYIWRVSQSSCWATFERYWYDQQNIMHTINISKPCNSDCCLRKMKVCLNEDNTVSKELLYIIADYQDCSGAISPEPLEICEYTCDMLQFDDPLLPKVPIEINEKVDESEFEKSAEDVFVDLKVVYSNSLMKLYIDDTNASNLNIRLYNLEGNEMINETFNLSSGTNILELDLSQLISGSYLYDISIDGKRIKSDKLNIVK